MLPTRILGLALFKATISPPQPVVSLIAFENYRNNACKSQGGAACQMN
jgi:hypothetical protein